MGTALHLPTVMTLTRSASSAAGAAFTVSDPQLNQQPNA
jgi:hypothetical protein